MDKAGVLGLVRVAQITAQRRLIRDKPLVLAAQAFRLVVLHRILPCLVAQMILKGQGQSDISMGRFLLNQQHSGLYGLLATQMLI